MPATATEVFGLAGVDYYETVLWGAAPSVTTPGVYIVSRHPDPRTLAAPAACPISATAVEQLLAVRPELRIDGHRPTADQLAGRIAAMWLADEPVLYIGVAGTSLEKRVNQYVQSKLGARSPHAGGWPLKCIAAELWVHVGKCDSKGAAIDAESAMQRGFVDGVSAHSRAAVLDPRLPLPFANLELREHGRRYRKAHGISGATGTL